MSIKGLNHQPRFGMYSFPMPNVHTPDQKTAQEQVIEDMIAAFKQQEETKDALIFYTSSMVPPQPTPGVRRPPGLTLPAMVNIDNTTAEQSILGRIQAFFQERGLEVNPFTGAMTSTGIEALWKAPVGSPPKQIKKQLRLDTKDDSLDL